ncbi:hypothetical protein, partial [Campylobacter fetus]
GGYGGSLATDTCTYKSREIRAKLISNLENLNLIWADGFEFIAEDLLKFENINLKNSIAILTYGIYGNRHFGDIFDILIKNNQNLFIVNTTIENYEKDRNFMGLKNILIPMNCLKYYNFKVLLSSVNISYQDECFAHQNTFAMVFSHHMTMLRSYLIAHKFCDITKQESIDTFGTAIGCYYIAAMKSDEIYFNALNSKAKLLKLGYPNIDKQIKNYTPKKPQKSVLVMFHHFKSYKKVMEAIDKLLNLKYEIIFRPNPHFHNQKENVEITKFFQGKKGFVYDDSPKLTNETLQKAICSIGDYSSTIFSFPLTTLKPCMLFYPSDIMGDDFEKENINGKMLSFADENLHIISRSVDELVNHIENLNLKEWNDKILKYRNEEIYNLGNSSQVISDLIMQKAK